MASFFVISLRDYLLTSMSGALLFQVKKNSKHIQKLENVCIIIKLKRERIKLNSLIPSFCLIMKKVFFTILKRFEGTCEDHCLAIKGHIMAILGKGGNGIHPEI